jgi:hypothetical protein
MMTWVVTPRCRWFFVKVPKSTVQEEDFISNVNVGKSSTFKGSTIPRSIPARVTGMGKTMEATKAMDIVMIMAPVTGTIMTPEALGMVTGMVIVMIMEPVIATATDTVMTLEAMVTVTAVPVAAVTVVVAVRVVAVTAAEATAVAAGTAGIDGARGSGLARIIHGWLKNDF